MSARQAHRRRQEAAARAREAARRRRQRRRLGIVVVLAVVLVAGIGGLAVSAGLAGLQTGPAPWSANTAGLAERLQAIGVPPLSPLEGTAVHIHQHLDLYVDGRKVTVPAGIGIDPAVGFAPLHTHDPSGVLHPWAVLRRVGGAVHPELPWRLLRRWRPAAAGLRRR